ncbi:effector-associated constant component EACC1 [Amycolatopsis heterodermiae]|uniref:effector-associated constant component EACC1 n=1 Tax=Amycolatopsis heterodermiae TaxID=3110235 RepID=UPI00396A8359
MSAWLRRPRRTDIRIAVERPDGSRIGISADRVRSPEQLTELLRAGLSGDTVGD